jgi:glycosyltransferase involved in cell wall biosynthesis
MDQVARVAFFPDTYGEIDGVANTSRQLEAFARKRGFPFLIACAGTADGIVHNGSVIRITCRRSRVGFRLDKKHFFDLAFWRHYQRAEEAILSFGPDLVHVTGPSDVGQLGVLLARRLHIPLIISWHTNLHQYAERRSSATLWFLPSSWQDRIGSCIRDASLSALLWFYGLGEMLFAPNSELVDMLAARTGKTVCPMHRGVDTAMFTPERRDRKTDDFVVGYVGRLTVEKNIRLLCDIEKSLNENGLRKIRFSIVGQGAEESWLKANLRRVDFAGVLTGEALARAYANMDAFVFPSRTDTFGNVVLEALASGVPAIVTDSGGPRFLIRGGETGFIARNASEFASHVQSLIGSRERLQRMRQAARAAALGACWDGIFEGMYADYERGMRASPDASQKAKVRQHPFVVTSGPA